MRHKWFNRSSRLLTGSATLALGGGVTAVLLSKFSFNNKSAVRAESSTSNQLTYGSSDEMKLKYVQVFFRHGARTPLTHLYGIEEVNYDRRFIDARLPYVEIPYIIVDNKSGGPRSYSPLWNRDRTVLFKGGVHAGMLTNQGRDQAYMLGKRLQERYSTFVGAKFEPQHVHVQSTNVDRCIESLSCVLAGLFDKSSFREEDPVQIRVNHLSEEAMIPSTYRCPALQTLTAASRDAINNNPAFVNLVQHIKSITGDPTSVENFDIMQIRDHIIARKTHGLPVPQFLLDVEDEICEAAVAVLVSHVCGDCVIQGNPSHLRNGLSLGIGRCLDMIRENLESHAVGSDVQRHQLGSKMALYSCHDSTVAPILLAFGCYDHEWPPYAADICIELYEKNSEANSLATKQHMVRVTYCGKEMRLRGCESPWMTLDQFLSVIKPYLLNDKQYQLECHSKANMVLDPAHHQQGPKQEVNDKKSPRLPSNI